MPSCKTCGKRIFFAKTKTGKRIPINEEPATNGNVIIERGVAVVLGRDARPGSTVRRYTTHFADCKQASLWRTP